MLGGKTNQSKAKKRKVKKSKNVPCPVGEDHITKPNRFWCEIDDSIFND